MGTLGDPLAEQAKGPFLNPVEMALSSKAETVGIVANSAYRRLFKRVFGPNAFADIETAYNNMAIAIAAFERSDRLDKFRSRFDLFVLEQTGRNPAFDASTFGVEIAGDGFREYVGPPNGFRSKFISRDEADGLALFNADSEVQLGVGSGTKAGGMCYLCHLTENHVVPGDDPNYANVVPGTYPPLFTDFSYDNLGIPVNPIITQLAGPQAIDHGRGGASRVAELQSLYPDLVVTGALAVDEIGKFKVSSLRNIAKTDPFSHNGYFSTLYGIVHFYNTRDTIPDCSEPLAEGETIGVNCWPSPEVPSTVNSGELGNLGLSVAQEMKIVMFLETLTDLPSH